MCLQRLTSKRRLWILTHSQCLTNNGLQRKFQNITPQIPRTCMVPRFAERTRFLKPGERQLLKKNSGRAGHS